MNMDSLDSSMVQRRPRSDNILFVDARSSEAQAAFSADSYFKHFSSLRYHTAALDMGSIYALIKKVDRGWMIVFNEHAFSAVHPDLESCKVTIRQRHGDFSSTSLGEYEKHLLDRWRSGDWTVREDVSELIKGLEVCSKADGYGIVIEIYGGQDFLPVARVYQYDGTPAGAFEIKDPQPKSQSDIVASNSFDFGTLTSETREKIVLWANGFESSVGNWNLMKIIWDNYYDEMQGV